MKVSEAKEATAAAIALREALSRMRRLFGANATAAVCERHATELIGANPEAAHLSDAEIRRIARGLGERSQILHKIIAVMSDRTMQVGEVHRAVIASGVPDYPSLRHYILSRINSNSAGKGEQIFVRVRHGWYRLRKKGEVSSGPLRFKKGELVCIVYDALGKEALDQHELSHKMIAEKLLPPDRCEPQRLLSTLINHSRRGTKAFVRDKENPRKFRAVAGRRPSVDTPELQTLQVICTILRGRSLSTWEIHERLSSRVGMPKLSRSRVEALLSSNAGNGGRRMFEHVSPAMYKVAKHIEIMEQMLQVMGSRTLSPGEIASLIQDTGHRCGSANVQTVLFRNTGPEMPFVRVARGQYARNRNYSL